MITVRGVDIRVGAHLLLSDLSFDVSPGDRVGLVGRNGAGKTTLMKTLAGEERPAAGAITVSGSVGYLPQARAPLTRPSPSPPASCRRAASMSPYASSVRRRPRWTPPPAMRRTRRWRRTRKPRNSSRPAVGTPPGRGARLAAGVGLPNRALEQPVGELSGGQRRRVELARILFARTTRCCSTSRPTTSTPTRCVAAVLPARVPRRPDRDQPRPRVAQGNGQPGVPPEPAASAIDLHNTGWTKYLQQWSLDERRRSRERHTPSGRRRSCTPRRRRCRPAPTRPSPPRTWRGGRTSCSPTSSRYAGPPGPPGSACPSRRRPGKTPLSAVGLKKAYGGLQVLNGVDLAVDRGSRVVILGLNGAGKTTLLRLLAGREEAGCRRGRRRSRAAARVLRAGA